MFVGMRVTARAIRRFSVIGAAVAAVAAVPAPAQAARSPRAQVAADTTDSVCGTPALASTPPALASAAGAPVAAAADLDAYNIAKWFGEKAGGAIAGKVAGMAFDYVTKLPGLKDIVPKSEGAQMLEALARIEDQLAAVTARLDLIGSKVDRTLTELRTQNLQGTLGQACGYVHNAEFVYQRYFIPTVQAGLALGEVLKSDTPGDATVLIDDLPEQFRSLYTAAPTLPPCGPSKLQLSCYSPKTLITARLDGFAGAMKDKQVLGSAGLLSGLLRPAELTTSVLTSYGKYLMTKRYLNHTDSESMLGLYNDLAQGEALTSWMEAEYYTYADAQEGSAGPDHVFKAYVTNRDAEQGSLPPIIPEGDVIDLQELNAATTRNHPIWTLATTKDETAWPINVESNNLVTTAADGAANAVKALNSQPCSDAPGVPCFTSWKIPTTVGLKGLLSDSCPVAADASQLPNGCKPLVNGAVGSPTVVQYLRALDPTNFTWAGVFCGGGFVSCATPPNEHSFVWTTDRRSHETKCGYEEGLFGIHLPMARTYSLRAGLPLNATNTNNTWPIYPEMPSQLPNYGLVGYEQGHMNCDIYAREQIAAPKNKGLVLVSQNTGSVGFMAQPAKAAVQDTTARSVVKDATADSKRYGRRRHGSFRGLSLRWFRHKVPEGQSGEPGYLIAAHAIDHGRGFMVTAQGEGTQDTFTSLYRPSGGIVHTCTRVHGGAGRHGCHHVRRGHGHW